MLSPVKKQAMQRDSYVKIDFILFGSKSQLEALANCFPVSILGSDLYVLYIYTEKVCNLGANFDSSFSFSDHACVCCYQVMHALCVCVILGLY